MKNNLNVQIFDYVHTGAEKSSLFRTTINFVAGTTLIIFLITLLVGLGYSENTSSTDFLVQEGVSLFNKTKRTESPKTQHKYSKKEFENFLKAAKQDNATAQYNVGIALIAGDEELSPFNQDIPAGINWLEKSAANGFVEAMIQLADLYFFNEEYRDFNKGYSWSLKAADRGNSKAMFLLHLLTGDSTENFYDLDESSQWLVKAADAEDPDAMFTLALTKFEALDSDEGNPMELIQEINKLLLKAADQGHGRARQILQKLNDILGN